MSKMSKIDQIHLKGCNTIYVEDVKDISNTPKGCNAMYVKDIEDGKRTYTHIFAHNFLNIQPIFNPAKSFGKLRLIAYPTVYHEITVKVC